MAKRQRRRKLAAGGPYLGVAALCEKVLQDKDGVASLIRIVDRVTVTVSGPEAPDEMPAVPLSYTAAIMLKSGIARGKYVVTLRGETPSGETMPQLSTPVLFEGDERGVNLFVNLNLQVKEEGLYWFDVLVEDAVMTRIPLRVMYQRVSQRSS